MGEDQNALLRQIAVDIAVIKTKLEEQEKLNLSSRVSTLEKYMYYAIGGLILINASLGVFLTLIKK